MRGKRKKGRKKQGTTLIRTISFILDRSDNVVVAIITIIAIIIIVAGPYGSQTTL